jgi:hypothetical protein
MWSYITIWLLVVHDRHITRQISNASTATDPRGADWPHDE